MPLPPLLITPLYASFFTLMLLYFSIRVIRSRWRHKVPFNDGNVSELTRNIRAHGNFAEYVPFALILLLLGELNGAPHWMLHLIGAILLIGRLFHAYGLFNKAFVARVIGMSCTFISLALGAIFLITTFFNAI